MNSQDRTELGVAQKPGTGPDCHPLDSELVGELLIVTRAETDGNGGGQAAPSSFSARYTVVSGPHRGQEGAWQPPAALARPVEDRLPPGWSAPALVVPLLAGGVGVDFDISGEDRKVVLDVSRGAEAKP